MVGSKGMGATFSWWWLVLWAEDVRLRGRKVQAPRGMASIILNSLRGRISGDEVFDVGI